jgi:Zn-dependent protease
MAAADSTTSALSIRITPGSLVLLVLIPLVGIGQAWMIIGCLLLHELGHWAAARTFGIGVDCIGLCALGGYISRRHGTRFQDILVSLSGPLANLLLFDVFILTQQQHRLAAVNLLLFVVNMLPVPGTDGWRALQAVRR